MRTLFVAEPPRPWIELPKLVVDASVLASFVFAEPNRDEAEAQMRGRGLCAPTLVDYEFANVALNKIRRKAVSIDHAGRALTEYADLDVERWEADPAELVRIGGEYGLSAYDASYLWVAGHLRAPLATFDKRLAAAASLYLKQLPAS